MPYLGGAYEGRAGGDRIDYRQTSHQMISDVYRLQEGPDVNVNIYPVSDPNDLTNLGTGEFGELEPAFIGHLFGPQHPKEKLLPLGGPKHSLQPGLHFAGQRGQLGPILGQQNTAGAIVHPIQPPAIHLQQAPRLDRLIGRHVTLEDGVRVQTQLLGVAGPGKTQQLGDHHPLFLFQLVKLPSPLAARRLPAIPTCPRRKAFMKINPQPVAPRPIPVVSPGRIRQAYPREVTRRTGTRCHPGDAPCFWLKSQSNTSASW